MFKHLLIPTDGSELSEKAVSAGITLAKAFNAKVTALHAYSASLGVYYGEAAWLDDRIQAHIRETAEAEGGKYLDRVESAARSGGVEFNRVLLEADAPWKSIIDTAQNKGCDLIVMAAHGRRGLSALVIGSETNKVLIHSKIPVLVYR